MLIGNCHCGAVRIEVLEIPQAVISCSCSICRRTGALWARYPQISVKVYGHPEHTSEAVLSGRFHSRMHV